MSFRMQQFFSRLIAAYRANEMCPKCAAVALAKTKGLWR